MRRCVLASSRCATISPSRACSGKFLEPTTIVSCPRALHPHNSAMMPKARPARRIFILPSPRGTQAPFENAQQKIRAQGEKGRGYGARENQRIVHHRQAAEDVLA